MAGRARGTTHGSTRTSAASASPTGPRRRRTKKDHLLREAFRRTCFQQFKDTGRRDTFEDELVYEEKCIEKVRKVHYQGPTGHHRNVLMGGGVSEKLMDDLRTAKGQAPK
jgi:hypothetical protein